jgi:predicted DNA binding protein
MAGADVSSYGCGKVGVVNIGTARAANNEICVSETGRTVIAKAAKSYKQNNTLKQYNDYSVRCISIKHTEYCRCVTNATASSNGGIHFYNTGENRLRIPVEQSDYDSSAL